ncbi:hypothetical protein ASPTUDRAFT_46973 [Aspergillus tubingensis CBS 134.48]|uniref:Uncharacterized protein n=1 Tax=Aspergillus tubingensis (strain CBS 134.48) TaxID=767770 RepID=A0A1L9MWY4_ASPTC|nr:hypothetical protein ASPTUDRAFT_46973 [Aspergillus tubingensis CBS 134.48]
MISAAPSSLFSCISTLDFSPARPIAPASLTLLPLPTVEFVFWRIMWSRYDGGVGADGKNQMANDLCVLSR